jgi:type II secretory pathway component PulF
MTADDLTALNEQIAAMARAGLPLDQGLQELAQEMGRGQLSKATHMLASDLQAGLSLPEALARQSGTLPPYYANLVTAGIQSGRLPEVLATLTGYARAISSTRATVIESFIYPAVVLVLGMSLFAALSVFILPQFEKIFQEFGLNVPGITQMLMFIGHNPMETLLLPFLVVVLVIVAIWVDYRYTSHGKKLILRILYLTPILGGLIRAVRLAAFCDLLAMLVEYELPLPAAVRLAGAASSDPIMAERALQVEKRLDEGKSFAVAFHGLGLLPDWVAWLATTGERRGDLAAALRSIGTIYRRRVESRSLVLRTILPPLVVICTAGFLTCFFAIGLMLPMIKLLEGLSK